MGVASTASSGSAEPGPAPAPRPGPAPGRAPAPRRPGRPGGAGRAAVRAGGPPGRQREVVVDPDELSPDRQPDPHLAGTDAEQLADHPDTLRQLHQRDDERQGLARHRRVVMDHVAVDLAGTGRDRVPALAARRPLGHPAAGAHRPRRVAQRPALPAPLDPQFPGRGPGPEERGVRRHLRPHDQGRGGGRPGLRAELEDPEVHGRHRLIPRVPGGTRGHEPALTQRGPLGAGDVEQAGPHADLLTMPQVAVVDLVAVGGHDGGVAGLIERQRHRAERVVIAAAAAVQARHRPDLDHGGRGHEGPVPGGGRGRRVGVHRAGVADGLDPVADHRQVHRVAAGAGAALARGGDPPGAAADRVRLDVRRLGIRRAGRAGAAHRGTRGSPSPAVAMSSRWISLTPPPNVSTVLRFAWTSSHRVSSAVSGSAGSP